jgi:hypothetical protein
MRWTIHNELGTFRIEKDTVGYTFTELPEVPHFSLVFWAATPNEGLGKLTGFEDERATKKSY